MDKTILVVAILAGIALVGVITLLTLEKDVDVLLPILTTLVGIIIGNKKEAIMAAFKKS